MSGIVKSLKSLGKRFIQGLHLQNAKRFLDTSAQILKVTDAVAPSLIKVSPHLEKILNSDTYKNVSKSVRIADNILNRGEAMTDKNAVIIKPPTELDQARDIVKNVRFKRL